MALLNGHMTSVVDLAVNEDDFTLISVSLDKVLKGLPSMKIPVFIEDSSKNYE